MWRREIFHCAGVIWNFTSISSHLSSRQIQIHWVANSLLYIANHFCQFQANFAPKKQHFFWSSVFLSFTVIWVSGESSGTIKGIIGMTFNREKGELELQLGTERRGKRRMKRLAFNDMMCARTRIFLNPFISEDEQQQEKEEDEGSPAAQSCLLHRQPVTSCNTR